MRGGEQRGQMRGGEQRGQMELAVKCIFQGIARGVYSNCCYSGYTLRFHTPTTISTYQGYPG